MSECTVVDYHPPVEVAPPDEPAGSPPRVMGQVKFFNDRKKWGFVSDISTGIDYFVHISSIVPKWPRHDNSPATLYTGEYCTFTVCPPDEEGGQCRAIDVRGIENPVTGEQMGLMCDFGKIRFTKYARHHMPEENSTTEEVTTETIENE